MNLEDEDLKVALVMFFVIFSVIFSYQNIKSKKIINKAPNEEAKNLKISYIPSLAAAIASIAMLIFILWLKTVVEVEIDKWGEYSILIGIPTSIFYLFNKKYNSEYLKLKKIVESIEEYKDNKKYDAEINAAKDKLNNHNEKQIISNLNQKSTLTDEEKQIISKIKAKKTREFWFTAGAIILAVVIVYLQLA
jgi:hypothetical protein